LKTAQEKQVNVFKNFGGDNKLNQIYGKTFQNYKKLVEVFPDNEIIILSHINKERKKRKERSEKIILTTEQIYSYK